MSKEIFEIRSMGDALRNTGYRGIDCAIAEIVDNSIEAGAKNVFVITSECTNENTGRKGICEIAIGARGLCPRQNRR